MTNTFKHMCRIGGIMIIAMWSMQANAAGTPTDKVVEAFMELDQDASNGVSMPEYMSMVNRRARERFARMDQNHDGEVSEDEYRLFWQTQKAKWYRLHR